MDKPPPPRSAIIVHAGAWAIPSSEKKAHLRGCARAAETGWAVLCAGGTSLDAVRAAIRSMEDDRHLNAGAGSVLTRDGHVENDAGLMDGTTLDSGGVAGIRDRANPIEAAACVLASTYALFVGEGAMKYLDSVGLPKVDPQSLIEQRERDRLQEALQRATDEGRDFIDEAVTRPGRPLPGDGGHEETSPGDTVGAVAIDSRGRIAAGSSTGGICGKPPGRMGDSAVPGAGYYADNLLGGAACTGWGEPLLRMGMARRAVDFAREHNAMDATWLAMQEFEKRYKGRGGVILISRDGSIGYSFNTPSMATAFMDGDLQTPHVGGVAPD